MLQGIKRPEDLQDKDILTNMDAHRGAGVQFGEFISQRNGDTPFNFVQRVKGEYRAWFDRKEAEDRRRASVVQGNSVGGIGGPTFTRTSGLSQTPIQSNEESLGETLKAKVDALAQGLARKEAEYRDLIKETEVARKAWHEAYADLRIAERLLRELEKEDGREYPPEDSSSMGGDIPQEVGRRRKTSRSRMGQSRDSKGSDPGRAEGDAGVTSVASGLEDLKQ